MTLRMIVAVLSLVAIGVLVLAIRQQRLATARAISQRYSAIESLRTQTRTLMPPISARTSPEDIAAACKRAKLQLEPVTPAGQVLPSPPEDQNGVPANRSNGGGRP